MPLTRRSTAIALGSAFVTLLTGCSPTYVLRAGYEEAKILRRREPIAELVRDPRTPPERRAKLALVLEVRRFAAETLALKVGDSYTTFSELDRDTLALVLSAAQPDRFEPHTWWFPVVGQVPYKGFFSQRKAEQEIQRLQRRGLDTYLRPTSAFSTLGWFNDPLVSPLLRADSAGLANTVIHELFHNTLYLPGQAEFNESLANFVGARGSILFFCAREGPEGPRCRAAADDWHDERLFGTFLSELVEQLETLYARVDLDRAGKLREREQIFAAAQRRFAGEIRPRLRVSTFASFTRDPLNNASLISRRLYYRRLDLFERVFQRYGGDLPLTLRAILTAARASRSDPYTAVERLAES